ncbi:helix-turn-helix domain-containing protein [Aurantimonas sp. A2-1-M11]|uniref:helix-turn-helix domain-containing protein n=1 Tax=Aurantimonas sp. A2-1-M11 TaxID=3113712 RepID=UPI002F942FC0
MTTALATAIDRVRTAGPVPAKPMRAFRETTPRSETAGVGIAGQVLNFVQDSEIYAECEEVQSFYKVVSGVVRTCKFLSDGRRQIEGFHAAGDIFGLELGVAHNLSAEAVSDCTVVAYRWRGIQHMVAQSEQLAPQVFNFAMQCLERAQHHALLLGRRSAAQRVAAFLLGMAGRDGDETVVQLAMTRQDIADYLGLTIETVSRTLSQFERDGLIALSSTRHLVLLDAHALKALND